jgi:hypothetical protein
MEKLISNFTEKNLVDFFKSQISAFKNESEEFDFILKDKNFNEFENLNKIGSVEFGNTDELIVFSCKYQGQLTERSSKKKQFEIAKLVLKEDFKDGAIFVFYDELGKFRFSFIRRNWDQKGDKKYSAWKRFTYFVDPNSTNKTFKQRIGNCSFKDLESIQDAFSVEKLTKDFYNDLFKWYQWTLSEEIGITFPNNTDISDDDRVKLEEQIIRLTTRVLFVWFIKQKHLVPGTLFDKNDLKNYLKDFDPSSTVDGNYYNAILQNLFFATLNRSVTEREFAKLVDKRDIKTKYRYAEMFKISEEEILDLFRSVPFLNGGLFECLDKDDLDGNKYFLDGFSRNDKKFANGNFKHRAFIPNCVFFDENNGLIPILERYNFTVEENAPNEIQVALDPELLGNVFENLLGAFNEETKETARKQSGSFYTPREVVSYMVDESLIAYLSQSLSNVSKTLLHQLFEDENLPDELVKDHKTRESIAKCLKSIKILDPACGSGAFPMGILNRMVDVLDRLDARSEKTIYKQKLHLIEECIYGVDIQTIATQISKLRFFISLIVEQEGIDLSKPEENYDVITLPNLETKFVSANTLVGLTTSNDAMLNLTDPELNELRDKLYQIRHDHFYAGNANKKKELRKQDELLRTDIKKYISENATKPDLILIHQLEEFIENQKVERKKFEGENWVDETIQKSQGSLFGDEVAESSSLFKVDANKRERDRIDKSIKDSKQRIERELNKSKSNGFEAEIEKLAKWDPYDQNISSSFFDATWMFGLEEGFDVVIGNPPYIQLQKEGGKLAKLYANCGYETFEKTGDIYSLFYERGWQLLKDGGTLCYITSNKWMRAGYGKSTRNFFAEKTNPILLIDFAGQKIFESATVDTNILLFSKDKNQHQTSACIVKEKVLNKLSIYIRQHANIMDFESSESWVILSQIEKSIKDKIVRLGTPLKKWDIRINYGIKTGLNEAFVIDSETRNRIIKQDPKSAEIIRPILRGRDIKRYSHVFPDLWLINTHNGIKESRIKPINIDDFPAIKEHLDQFYNELKSRSDKGDTPYNLRNCAYMEDFFRPKIIYPNMTKYLPFVFDESGYLTNQKCFIVTGEKIEFLTAFLNSSVFKYCFRDNFPELLGGTRELSKIFFDQIPVIEVTDSVNNQFRILVKKVQELKMNNQETKKIETEIENLIFDLYGLSKQEILEISSKVTE